MRVTHPENATAERSIVTRSAACTANGVSGQARV
jgi:hypothetical protein